MPANISTVAMIAELTKWKLSLAIAFSAVTGYLIYGGEPVSSLALAAPGVFLMSAGASALNQYTERKSDKLMERTAGRPLPSGRMTPSMAAGTALILILSGSIMLSYCGLLPMILGIGNVVLYNLVYTGLKKTTPLAIIPGALVGAVPPIIGYSAAGGAVTDTIIMLFALFMFLWQMPHFWLLLVRYGTDYEKAGIKTFYGAMSPVKINQMVLIWITGSSLLLWILLGIFMPIVVPVAVILLVLNIAFIIAFRMIIRKSEVRSGNAFILINSFSLLIMIILIAAS